MEPSATVSEISPLSTALDLYTLLDLPLGSQLITEFLTRACEIEGFEGPSPEPAVTSYPDMTFHSYHPLGLSLGFSSSPASPSSSPLYLVQIDLYNPPPTTTTTARSSSSSRAVFSPALQSFLPHPILRDSTARALLLTPELGEPSRKGGGEPNLGRLGLGVWMEWEKEAGADADAEEAVGREVEGEKGTGERRRRGMKVEFDERGAGCWERERLDKAGWRGCGLFLV